MSSTFSIRLATGLLALALAAPVRAGTPIDESRPLDAGGRLAVNNLAGLIEVSGWDRNEVSVRGQLGADVEALEIRGDARELSVFVRYPSRQRGGVEETILRLQVPRAAVLELEGVSSDIVIKGTRGTLQAASVSGDVDAQVESERVVLNSVSGDITLKAPARDAQLQSVSGDVSASGVSGVVKAETVSGDLELSGSGLTSVKAQSVSGDMVLDLGLAGGGTVQAETLSGQIRTRLQQAPDAVIALKTFSGKLVSEFGPGEAGQRRKLEKTLGEGRGRIELNSFSGDIHLGR